MHDRGRENIASLYSINVKIYPKLNDASLKNSRKRKARKILKKLRRKFRRGRDAAFATGAE